MHWHGKRLLTVAHHLLDLPPDLPYNWFFLEACKTFRTAYTHCAHLTFVQHIFLGLWSHSTMQVRAMKTPCLNPAVVIIATLVKEPTKGRKQQLHSAQHVSTSKGHGCVEAQTHTHTLSVPGTGTSTRWDCTAMALTPTQLQALIARPSYIQL